MSIKTSADEWVRKGPTQAIAVIAAVGLVVGLLIGLGVGFKIEQSRTKSDVTKLQKQLKAQTPTKGSSSGALGQRVGKVSATKPGSITVTTKQRGAQTVVTTGTTLFEQAAHGTIADVHTGLRVLVTVGAKEMIVLPATSKLGRVVTKVGSDLIKIGQGNGLPAGSFKTADVHLVSTVKAATAADVHTGDSVLVGGHATNPTTFEAVEFIVLPAGSGFAS
jgi:hypothetical protein